MGIVIVGEEATKRIDFFRKAAYQEKIPVSVVSWEEVNTERLEATVVKLEPPSFSACDMAAGGGQIEAYQEKLKQLGQASCRWVNTPEDILLVLDKYSCKKRLQTAGISVSPMFNGISHTYEELQIQMKQNRMYQVFVKPRFGSGAAGVMAYRRNRDGSRQQLFTSSVLENGGLVNTKRLRKVEKKEEIQQLLTAILKMDCVIEQWIPKAICQGKTYDIRAVWQFGRCKFMIARVARGPITNLHLNNGALEYKALGLTSEENQAIEQLCMETMEQFPGLSVAGLDIALDPNTHKPFVIEVNGQGDLMYQDIYAENRIYREQVREMEKWNKAQI